jgi:hypothetical protein
LPPEVRQFKSKVDVEETEKGLVASDDDPADPDSKYPLPETESLWWPFYESSFRPENFGQIIFLETMLRLLNLQL